MCVCQYKITTLGFHDVLNVEGVVGVTFSRLESSTFRGIDRRIFSQVCCSPTCARFDCDAVSGQTQRQIYQKWMVQAIGQLLVIELLGLPQYVGLDVQIFFDCSMCCRPIIRLERKAQDEMIPVSSAILFGHNTSDCVPILLAQESTHHVLSVFKGIDVGKILVELLIVGKRIPS